MVESKLKLGLMRIPKQELSAVGPHLYGRRFQEFFLIRTGPGEVVDTKKISKEKVSKRDKIDKIIKKSTGLNREELVKFYQEYQAQHNVNMHDGEVEVDVSGSDHNTNLDLSTESLSYDGSVEKGKEEERNDGDDASLEEAIIKTNAMDSGITLDASASTNANQVAYDDSTDDDDDDDIEETIRRVD